MKDAKRIHLVSATWVAWLEKGKYTSDSKLVKKEKKKQKNKKKKKIKGTIDKKELAVDVRRDCT